MLQTYSLYPLSNWLLKFMVYTTVHISFSCSTVVLTSTTRHVPVECTCTVYVISLQKTIPMVVWLLRHKQITQVIHYIRLFTLSSVHVYEFLLSNCVYIHTQLHTYVYIVPSLPSTSSGCNSPSSSSLSVHVNGDDNAFNNSGNEALHYRPKFTGLRSCFS